MDALEKVRLLTEQHRCARWLGLELVTLEPDRAVFELQIGPNHKNPYGILHGGICYAAADSAAGAAARTDGRTYVTRNGSIHHLRSVKDGVLRAEARVKHRGDAMCVVDVELSDGGGQLCALATLSFFPLDAPPGEAIQK